MSFWLHSKRWKWFIRCDSVLTCVSFSVYLVRVLFIIAALRCCSHCILYNSICYTLISFISACFWHEIIIVSFLIIEMRELILILLRKFKAEIFIFAFIFIVHRLLIFVCIFIFFTNRLIYIGLYCLFQICYLCCPKHGSYWLIIPIFLSNRLIWFLYCYSAFVGEG